MLSRQPEFTYNLCGRFNKSKNEFKILKIVDSRYLYQNELCEACFSISTWHDIW